MHNYVLSTLMYMHSNMTLCYSSFGIISPYVQQYGVPISEDEVPNEGETEIVDSDDDSDLSTVNVEDETTKSVISLNLVQMICVFLLSWQSSFRIPDSAMCSL